MSEPTLRRGSRGEAVARLQEALTGAGFDTDGADGVFGAGTEAAVKAFQAARGLASDGIVGAGTWGALGSGGTTSGTTGGTTAANSLQLSAAGAAFIGGFEGFRGQLYDDAAGHCTIGYGHLVHHGPCNGSEPAEFVAGITEPRAAELLQQDASAAAAAINRSVTVSLSQPQFDALVSFVFNVGTGAFAGSTLLRRLNAGEYAAVPAELNKWVNAGGQRLQGLVNRRAAEGALFAHGTY